VSDVSESPSYVSVFVSAFKDRFFVAGFLLVLVLSGEGLVAISIEG
jgi:hypothetical protein